MRKDIYTYFNLNFQKLTKKDFNETLALALAKQILSTKNDKVLTTLNTTGLLIIWIAKESQKLFPFWFRNKDKISRTVTARN